MNSAQYYLTQLLRLTVPEPLPPKVHQHTRACERLVRQRTRQLAKQALKADRRLQVVK